MLTADTKVTDADLKAMARLLAEHLNELPLPTRNRTPRSRDRRETGTKVI